MTIACLHDRPTNSPEKASANRFLSENTGELFFNGFMVAAASCTRDLSSLDDRHGNCCHPMNGECLFILKMGCTGRRMAESHG